MLLDIGGFQKLANGILTRKYTETTLTVCEWVPYTWPEYNEMVYYKQTMSAPVHYK